MGEGIACGGLTFQDVSWVVLHRMVVITEYELINTL